MDTTLPELEQAQILLAHKQADRIKEISTCLGNLHSTEVRLTVTQSVDETLRELDSARFDLVLCDRRLLTVKLIEQFNRLRSRGEPAATILLSNEADDQTRNIGRAIAALDAVPLNHLNEEALAHYIHIALRLGATQHLDNQAGQVLNAVGTFGDVFFYRGRFEANTMTMDWLSHSFNDFTGYPGRDYIGVSDGLRSLLLAEDLPSFDQWLENIQNNRRSMAEFRMVDELGRERWIETKGQPIWNSEQQRVTGVLGRVREVTQRRLLENRAERITQLQTLTAEFSLACSEALELSDLMRSTPKLIAKAFPHFEVCGVFQQRNKQFALVGSHGWKLNAPSDRFLPADISNELQFTLQQDEAVIIQSISQEQRFTPSHVLMSNGVKSGLCWPIAKDDFKAVLCIYSKNKPSIDEDDFQFLDTITRLIANSASLLQNRIQQKSESTTNNALPSIDLACQLLLGVNSWQRSAESALQRLGETFEASHALIYDLEAEADDFLQLGLRFEWAQPGKTNYGTQAATKYFDLASLGLRDIEEALLAGEHVLLDKSTAPELIRRFTCLQILIAPVMLQGSCWGCIVLISPQTHWQLETLSNITTFCSILSTRIQQQRTELRMREVIEGTAATTGDDFYSSLVKHMAQALRVDYCHIAQLNNDKGQATVVASWEQGEAGEVFAHDLIDSPCLRALEGDLVYYPDDVQALHPADDWLAEHLIHAYLAAPILNSESEVLGYLAIMHTRPMDVSENDLRVVRLFADRAAAEISRERIESDNRLLAAMPRENPSPIMRCTSSGHIEFANPACIKLCTELKLEDPANLLPDQHMQLIEHVLQQPDRVQTAEHTLDNLTLEWHYCAQQAQVHLYAIDISSHKAEEEQLRRDAFHDQLTGLPNRGFFKNLVNHSLEKSQQNEHYHFAVLFLDLDRFKVVNDSLGHDAGDQLLEEVASRLIESVRPGDYVARFGGDEFAILLDGVSDVHAATDIASKLQRALQQPIHLGHHESFTSASIGIAYSDRSYGNIEDMIRDADAAMYHSKNNGKAQHSVFNSDMHEQAIHMLQLETDLRKSIENKELRIHYQPIIDIARDALVGFEALVRWQHPKHGLMFPDDFIPLAEETGFVRELDRWVLDNATSQLQDWRGSIEEANELQLSLNLSGLHFESMEILSHIGNLLSGNDLSGHIKLELTESILMQNSGRSLEMFNILHARGLGISIDDFGVGYSSLSRIKRLPIDSLKIDRSFVQHMQHDQASLDIIRAIIDLAYNLKMEVVAEGVETPQQYKLLKRLGCHYAQGYYLSRPLPTDKATEFIQQPLTLKG